MVVLHNPCTLPLPYYMALLTFFSFDTVVSFLHALSFPFFPFYFPGLSLSLVYCCLGFRSIVAFYHGIFLPFRFRFRWYTYI